MDMTQTMKAHATYVRLRLPSRQRGATLLVGIIFLIVLMLLGISAATISSLDERMARNYRDRNIAFQAAEAALVQARAMQAQKLSGYFGFPSVAGSCSSDEDAAGKGLCRPAQEGQPVWEAILRDDDGADFFIEYASSEESPAFKTDGSPGSVRKPPRYLIEILPDLGSTDGLSTSAEYGASKVRVLYRISALGFGSNEGTQVLLQEVVRPQP